MLTRLRQLGLAAVLLAPLVAAPTAEASRGARPGGEASARGERPKASGPRLLPGRRLRQVTPRRALLQSNKIVRQAQRVGLRRALAHLDEVDLVVFDLDNTLVDSRERTAAAVRRFADVHGAALPRAMRHRLRSVRAADVGYGHDDTAALLNIPSASRPAFYATWEAIFRPPQGVELDAPIAETLTLARAAAARGIEVRYVTGRPTDDAPGDGAHRTATLAQLRRIGAPLASEAHLVTRGAGFDHTQIPAFKRRELVALSRGRRVLFVDDSTANLHATADLATVKQIAVAFAVREPGWRMPADAERMTIRRVKGK